MQADIAPRLETLRPAIKARWEALLREEPASPEPAASIVRPEMLVFMLDDTMGRLEAKLREPLSTGRLRRDLAPYGAMRAGCRCGLHLLLTYYLTGARALRETLPAEVGPGRVAVLHTFNQLAHDEMEALCGVCRYRGGLQCGLRPAARAVVSPPGAGASPAMTTAPGRSPGGTPG